MTPQSITIAGHEFKLMGYHCDKPFVNIEPRRGGLWCIVGFREPLDEYTTPDKMYWTRHGWREWHARRGDWDPPGWTLVDCEEQLPKALAALNADGRVPS